MRTFLLICLVLSFGCAKDEKASLKQPAPGQEINPDEKIKLLETQYHQAIQNWKYSVEKECSLSHILNQKIAYKPQYDYQILIEELERYALELKSLNADYIIELHPEWKKLSMISKPFRERRQIKSILVQSTMKDGVCQLTFNDKIILSQKLITTIPVLYSFQTKEIKSIANLAPQYQLSQFKQLELLKKSMQKYSFTKNVVNVAAHEKLSGYYQKDRYCKPSTSLFTLLQDDLAQKKYRCLFSFQLSALGISHKNQFLYQLVQGSHTREKVVELDLPEYPLTENVRDFSQSMEKHVYQIDEGIKIDYSVRVINNCHFQFNLKREYVSSLFETYNVLMANPITDIRLKANRNNNLVTIRHSNNLGSELIIRFENYKKAKRIFWDLVDIKKECQSLLTQE